MRGKDSAAVRNRLEVGITPAYAGKRSKVVFTGSPIEDHPRLCGEKVQFWTCNTFEVGSPPPMRGKDDLHKLFAVFFGITPAYAGKRPVFSNTTALHWDHPRLCGEKTGDSIADMQAKGSPPPMRGKVICRITFRSYPRITPAYAGKRHAMMA